MAAPETGSAFTAEFSSKIPLTKLAARPLPWHVEANETERAIIAERYGLASLDRLVADLEIAREGKGARVTGRFQADAVQSCVLSGEPLPVRVDEPLDLAFLPEEVNPNAEVELEEDALDVIPLQGDSIDLAEAVAESLLLALDPYPRASDAVIAKARAYLMSEEEAAKAEEEAKMAASPFAKLLKK